MTKPIPGAKRGRPPENREEMTIHVLPATAAKIKAAVDKEDPTRNTHGKIVDRAMSPGEWMEEMITPGKYAPAVERIFPELQPYQRDIAAMYSSLPEGTEFESDIAGRSGWKCYARKDGYRTHRWTGKSWVKLAKKTPTKQTATEIGYLRRKPKNTGG